MCVCFITVCLLLQYRYCSTYYKAVRVVNRGLGTPIRTPEIRQGPRTTPQQMGGQGENHGGRDGRHQAARLGRAPPLSYP